MLLNASKIIESSQRRAFVLRDHARVLMTLREALKGYRFDAPHASAKRIATRLHKALGALSDDYTVRAYNVVDSLLYVEAWRGPLALSYDERLTVFVGHYGQKIDRDRLLADINRDINSAVETAAQLSKASSVVVEAVREYEEAVERLHDAQQALKPFVYVSNNLQIPREVRA